MSQRNESGRDAASNEEPDRAPASRRQASEGAWGGADLDRPIMGENPDTDDLAEARHWVAVYSHLVMLEQQLMDVMAGMIPGMPAEAQLEAEETNLPVLASQVERFRHRLDFWSKRRRDLERA